MREHERNEMGKGDNFEREMCRYLSLWWSEGERDDIFWRNRTRITSKTKDVIQQMGDLTAVQPSGIPFIELFSVEFKVGYSKTKQGKRTKIIPWDVLDIIDGKPTGDKVLFRFWEQTFRDAMASQRIPMLIFKRDHHTPCVCLDRKGIHIINRISDRLWESLLSPSITITSDLNTDNPSLCIYPVENFFSWMEPQDVIHMKDNNIESLIGEIYGEENN